MALSVCLFKFPIFFFFFQAEDGIRDLTVTGVQTCALPICAEFEQQFAKFCGVRRAIAVNSGTSSLEIILRALGDEGRDVLVPTNTFFATAAAVLHAGARPVLVDMDPVSFAIRPEALDRSLTPGSCAVISVHIGGIVSRRIGE